MPPITAPVNLIGMPTVKPIVEPDEFNSPVALSYGFNRTLFPVATVFVTVRLNSVYKTSLSLVIHSLHKHSLFGAL